MLYLLAVLTFLAGILFYGLSPRDDKLQLNINQAEGMIVAFVNQHQAAKDYVYTWLGAAKDGDMGVNTKGNLMAASQNLKAGANSDPYNPFTNLENFMPQTGRKILTTYHGDYPGFSVGLVSSMCKDNFGVPGENSCVDNDNVQMGGFVSRVLCTNADGTPLPCNNASAKKHYLYTFGGWKNGRAPDWWPNGQHPLRRYESWRRAIAQRTRGSSNCGMLWYNGGSYCIDNGVNSVKNNRQCKTVVPDPIITDLRSIYANPDQLDDLMFCYSEFTQGIGEYASNPDYFYDGIANVDVATYGDSGGNPAWQNLGNEGYKPVPPGGGAVPFSREAGAIKTLNGYIDFPIPLNFSNPVSEFTVNVVLRSPPQSGADVKGVDIVSVYDGANRTVVFKKAYSGDNYVTPGQPQVTSGRLEESAESHDAFCLFGSGGAIHCFDASYLQPTGTDNVYKSDGIISWTLVKRGNAMKMYNNTTLRSDQVVSPPSILGTLSIGGTDPGAVLYGVRYWPRALTEKEIQQNYSVDFRRFVIPDPDVTYDYNSGLYK